MSRYLWIQKIIKRLFTGFGGSVLSGVVGGVLAYLVIDFVFTPAPLPRTTDVEYAIREFHNQLLGFRKFAEEFGNEPHRDDREQLVFEVVLQAVAVNELETARIRLVLILDSNQIVVRHDLLNRLFRPVDSLDQDRSTIDYPQSNNPNDPFIVVYDAHGSVPHIIEVMKNRDEYSEDYLARALQKFDEYHSPVHDWLLKALHEYDPTSPFSMELDSTSP